MNGDREIRAEALTADAFAPFGEVVAVPAVGGIDANEGTARRFLNIANLEFSAAGGRPSLDVFRVRPARLPLVCARLERHPLSSQAFVPLGGRRFLIVVAPPGGRAPDAGRTQAFVADGSQGVNYRPGTWHHPLLALDVETDFLELGRVGPGDDCDVANFAGGARLRVTVG